MKNIIFGWIGIGVIFVGIKLIITYLDILDIKFILLLLLYSLPFGIGIFISHKFGKLCKSIGGKYWIGFFGGPISTIYYIGKKFKEK